MRQRVLLGSTDEEVMNEKGVSQEQYEYEDSIPDDEIVESFSLEQLIDNDNVADLLDDEKLDELALDVIRTYDMDKVSRSHREKSMDEAMNLALQITEEKTFPWPNASSVSYPIIAEASIEFAARAYPAILRSEQIAMGKVVGSDKGLPVPAVNPQTGQPTIGEDGKPVVQMMGAGFKKQQATRIADFMNYQLTEEIEGWEEDTDKLLVALPVVGNMFRKMYWNKELARPESCLVYPRHLVVNYKAKSLERAPRITEEIELYPYEIIERIRLGTFRDFGFDQAHTTDEALSERDHSSELQKDWNNPHLLLQQYRKLDLDGDGYPEPYIVTVHKDKAKVVRIKANFHEDGIIRNDKEEIAKIKCEQYYIKYGFIPSPDGAFYDLGWGELLLSLNKTINASINRLMDAGTLANTSQGFLAKGVKVQGGTHSFKPGMFKKVDTQGRALKDSFVQIQHNEPSKVMFELLGFLVDAAKSMGSLKSVLSGQQIGNQSGLAALTHVEQGLNAFKSIFKRVRRSVKNELRVLFRINNVYLDDVTYYNVLDDEKAVARKDFDIKRVDVKPASDPSVVTDIQRMAKAQFLTEFKDDPYFQGQEGGNGVKLREKIFEYVGEDSDGLISAPPPPKEDPATILARMEELKEQNQTLKIQSENTKTQLDMKIKEKDLEIKGLLAQVKVGEAQAKVIKSNQESGLANIEAEKKRAEIDNIETQSIKNIAEAEAVESGQQISQYQAIKEGLNEDNETGNT